MNRSFLSTFKYFRKGGRILFDVLRWPYRLIRHEEQRCADVVKPFSRELLTVLCGVLCWKGVISLIWGNPALFSSRVDIVGGLLVVSVVISVFLATNGLQSVTTIRRFFMPQEGRATATHVYILGQTKITRFPAGHQRLRKSSEYTSESYVAIPCPLAPNAHYESSSLQWEVQRAPSHVVSSPIVPFFTVHEFAVQTDTFANPGNIFHHYRHHEYVHSEIAMYETSETRGIICWKTLEERIASCTFEAHETVLEGAPRRVWLPSYLLAVIGMTMAFPVLLLAAIPAVVVWLYCYFW